MEKAQLQQIFNTFLVRYDTETKDDLWVRQSQQFKDFWKNRILTEEDEALSDVELDQIIKILDRHGRGNTKESEAIAGALIAQGAWRRMFNGIKVRREFSSLLNEIFLETRDEKRSEKINKLYKLNEVRKINNLTVPSGNAVCTLLAAFDPFQNLSMISLYERGKLSVFLGIDDIDYSSDNIGGTIVSSNERIIKYFKDSGIHHSARTISVFLYSPEFKPLWRTEQVDDSEPNAESFLTPNEEVGDPSLFYMESQLEDFLINNWEKTEFGKKYDLIEEDGALVSQQFRTDIGIIDILAKDKKTTQLVVIELKKSQTSDDTVGQLTRYMGWLETHKTGGKEAKGIIIAGHYDERLYYALKKLRDVEIYLYQVDFKLKEFKE